MFNFFSRKNAQPERLFFTTDIHCHVLPGIDDGSPNADMSATLIRRMLDWGVERIIASPHVTEGTFENTPETMDAAMAEIQAVLDTHAMPAKLSHSAEYRLDDLFKRQFEEKNICPLPGDYLLVENSFIQEPWGLDQILFQIKVNGYTPILAHPERYTYYYTQKKRYKKLHDEGTLFQVNLLSLSGHYGKEQRQMALWLMEHDMIDFLGSDLHNLHHAASIERYLASRDYRNDRKRLDGRILNDTL